jgi:hypothetical protein
LKSGVSRLRGHPEGPESCQPGVLKLILKKVLNKRISADGKTKANVASNYKGRRRE